MKKVEVLCQDQQRVWLKELCQFAAIPNNVFVPSQVRENAHYLQVLLQEHGFNVEQWDTPSGKPYVFASLITDENLPTLLIYSHYDGVPVDSQYWTSDPFVPVLRDGTGKTLRLEEALQDPEHARLYARSVADSKNATISLLAALSTIKEEGAKPGINLKLLLDGEEELESPYLKETVLAHRQELTADLMISASGEAHQSGLPTIAFGVRGILMLDLTLYTATTDMHSGHFGNFTPNAALEMGHLLALLKDRDGKVKVPGFYDGIVPLTAQEHEVIDRVPPIEEMIKEQFGIRKTEQARSLQELINQPTFNVRGLQAGYVGEQASNIIPCSAQASIDMRLVEGMDPDTLYLSFVQYLQEKGYAVSATAPTAAQLRTSGPILHVQRRGCFKAVKANMQAGLPRQVLQVVQQSTVEPWVVEPTEGGSLNFEVFRELGTDLITLPVSNFDCNQHTHDENLRLDFFLRGIAIFKALVEFKP
ncbi:M20/M25/M40 family metallo-hydrolase [Pontibacter sp. MBLB2868]|uniref:M20/M25/M40 family metallo-hydrolase n=1 Tax=Pontibacter sp. MBLB2868 TaxID=3451555 RepID=UPI003F7553AC